LARTDLLQPSFWAEICRAYFQYDSYLSTLCPLLSALEKDGVSNMHVLATLNANVIAMSKISSASIPLLSLGTQKQVVTLTSEL
jgi:hypothetical protein